MTGLGGAILIKALVMASITLAVIHSHLSAFTQALIIASVSAALTGVFTVVAAIITVRFTRPVREEIHAVHEQVTSNEDE